MAKFPEDNVKLQVKHILNWSIRCALFEFIGLKYKMIYFKNGWNIFWSWLIYVFLFSYGYAYSKRPLHVWVLSIPTLFFFLLKFKAPCRKIMMLGPFLFILRRFKKTSLIEKIKGIFNNYSQKFMAMECVLSKKPVSRKS
jgi:hypothetical protein